MPTPKTIEELLKMKPCPFENGHVVTGDEWINLIENSPHTKDLILAIRQSYDFKTPFKMPDGYYHLPPDKHLGLPLGYYSSNQLLPLIDSLPLSVLKEYCWRQDIACITTRKNIHLEDFGCYFKWFKILKQPPNLYNPLDHKAEDVPKHPTRFSFMQAVERAEPVWYYDFNLRAYKSIVARAFLFSIDLSDRKGKGIWADDPTAYLAWKTEQEGKS
jgi:hypothetical protein